MEAGILCFPPRERLEHELHVFWVLGGFFFFGRINFKTKNQERLVRKPAIYTFCNTSGLVPWTFHNVKKKYVFLQWIITVVGSIRGIKHSGTCRYRKIIRFVVFFGGNGNAVVDYCLVTT